MKIKIGTGKVLIIIIGIGMVLVILFYLFNPKKAFNLILPGLNEISYIHIDLKKDSALVKFFVLVQNKMPYKMVIDTIHFEARLNGFKMVEETLPVKIDQLWLDTDTIELPVNIQLKETNEIIEGLQGKDSTEADISFYIVYKTIIGLQRIHIERKIIIASPIPPKITILKLEHKKYNMKDKTSEAVVKIEIINDDKNMDLQLNSVNYNLQIKNTLFSRGIFAGQIDIKPSSRKILDIPIIVEYDRPFKTAWAIATDQDMMEYDLNIKSEVIVKSFKTTYKIPVEVDATGRMELVK